MKLRKNKFLYKKILKKGQDFYKEILSNKNFNEFRKLTGKKLIYKTKLISNSLFSKEYFSKVKNLPNSDLIKKFKKNFYNLSTSYQNYIEKLVNNLVKEEGSEIWSGLSQSQKWSGLLIWTFVGVTSFGMVWSFFSLIDDTIQVVGKLEPRGTTIEVKVPLGGVIKKIFVSEGDVVKENQVLLELDTRAAKSRLEALNVVQSQVIADIVLSKMQLGDDIEINNLNENQKIKLESLKSEYKSRIEASKNAVEQAKYRKNSNAEQIKTLEKVLEIREEVLDNLKSLIEIGGLSKVKYLKEQQEVIELRGRLESTKNDLRTSISILNEAENRLSNTIAASKIDSATRIEENEKQLAQLKNQINEAKLTLSYQAINSPLNGLVFDLQPAVPGYVVNTELPILKIVPIDDLVARVFVSNRDIAFLKVGQQVKVRVDAYSYNEFGEIKGIVDSIGSDVLEPDSNYNFYRFPVTIKIENPYILYKNKRLPLRTGMSLTANIVLRQRPVLSLFTERILPFWSGLEQL
tara:strand:+ start:178 stop:1734 length:1557 start_codon:yes stop_codon:yes gene_type:complete